MPVLDTAVQEKIDELRALRTAGTPIRVYQCIKVEWPSPTGTKYYGLMPIHEPGFTHPDDPPCPVVIDTRLKAESMPDYFLPVPTEASIGDEELDLVFEDFDEAISTLMNTHGEGVKLTLMYWLPQVELLHEEWQGHLEYGDEETVESISLKAVQGFRTADSLLPNRGHYDFCSAIFGGLQATQGAIDEGDCPYNKHLGGSVGINDPSTGQPWTYCDRRGTASCSERGVPVLYHLSHRSTQASYFNNQPGGGPRLLITTQGNENFLKEPVRVVMGWRRMYNLNLLRYSRPSFGEHGWFHTMFEVCEGPIDSLRWGMVTVGGVEKWIEPQHYDFVLGTKGQRMLSGDLGTHNYSSTAVFRYNFGQIDPTNLGPGDASAHIYVYGLNNIRVYTDPETYTEELTNNRAWHLMRMLCDKRWGYGLDYERLDIQSFIDAAAWCEETVRFTDSFGTDWDHIRSESHVELIGKKVQQQIEDLCMAGRLSRPFLFNNKIHIIPLRALTQEELDACPVFTDEGDTPNIAVRGEAGEQKTTLKILGRKSVKDLINRVEVTYDSSTNDYRETPLRPVEDMDAQLAAGRLVGDKSRKINSKAYPLLGVVNDKQVVKMAWSLLDLGPNDEGGLQNNLSIEFELWFTDVLDLHLDKVIKVVSSRLDKYGFTYFRIKKLDPVGDLHYKLTCQAYNETYMATFERPIGLGGTNDNAMIVSGAGTSSMDGTWNKMGTSDNGFPWYQKDTLVCEVRWNEDLELMQWNMGNSTYVGISGFTATAEPWDETWGAGDNGTLPAPTVTEGSASPDPEPAPNVCSIDSDCPDGFRCVNNVCVPEPVAESPGFGTITLANGTLTMEIPAYA